MPLALSLADQGALELGERAHHRQHQVRHRRVFADEGQAFLDELDAYAALGELVHQPAQIVEVARQAVPSDHSTQNRQNRVIIWIYSCYAPPPFALAHEGEQPFQLGALGVLARCLVGEQPVYRNMFKLAFRVLVERLLTRT